MHNLPNLSFSEDAAFKTFGKIMFLIEDPHKLYRDVTTYDTMTYERANVEVSVSLNARLRA